MSEKQQTVQNHTSDEQADITGVFAALQNPRVPLHRLWESQGARVSQAHGKEVVVVGA